MTLHDGRYGPYVKHGKLIASLPKGSDPEQTTLASAVQVLAERAAKQKAGKAKPKAKAKPKPKAKTKTTKTATTAKSGTAGKKKPAAKKKSPAKKAAKTTQSPGS